MPYNGSGVYSPPAADFPAIAGTLIQASKFNSVINDLANALSSVIVADGQRAHSANQGMGTFRHTNVGNAAARNEYAAAGQVQDQAFIWCGTAGGTADALTLGPSPSITVYTAGQTFVFKSGASPNTGATTVAVSGLVTKAIQNNGVALAAGMIQASKWYRVTYDGAAFQLEQMSVGDLLLDSVFKVLDDADPTKGWKVQVSGVATGQTRTASVPNYDHALPNVPVGCIMDYAGATAPTGWLECNGASLAQVGTYADLYAAIGTTWGSVDANSFNIPDFRGRTTIGKGTGVTVEVSTSSSGNGFVVTSNNTKWITGMPVVLSALSGFTTSATAGPTYYVVRISSTNIRLATTLALAQNLTPDVTVSGSGSVTITHTYTARTLAEVGGEETHAMTITELLAHNHLSAEENIAGFSGGGVRSGNPVNVNTGSRGGNAAMNTIQPFAGVMKIIRAT